MPLLSARKQRQAAADILKIHGKVPKQQRKRIGILAPIFFMAAALVTIACWLLNMETESEFIFQNLPVNKTIDKVTDVNPKNAIDETPDTKDRTVYHLLHNAVPQDAKIHVVGDDNSITVKQHVDGSAGEFLKLDKCQHTMVTGYFPMRSKHSGSDYLDWMTNFLSLDECMVIFTTTDMLKTIGSMRSGMPKKTVLIEMTLNDLPISQLGREFWEHQLSIDREKKIHRSYEVFWIWLSKSWCVVQAVQLDFFRSRTNDGIFLWQDIGSFRRKRYNGQKILVHTEIVPPKTILWLAHHKVNPPSTPLWNQKLIQPENFFHSGSQGAGSSEAWLEFHDKFAAVTQQFLDRDMFIGEDQCVLQSTCQLYPKLCAYIEYNEIRDNFYFGLRDALQRGGRHNLRRLPNIKEQTR